MKRYPLSPSLAVRLLASLALATVPAVAEQDVADVVFANGYIYTADENRNVAEAIAIQGEKILAVGTTADMDTYVGKATQVIDLHGGMVMPGLQDVHIHALGVVEPDMCDLKSQAFSLEGLAEEIAGCVKHYGLKPGEQLFVAQWNFSSGNEPGEKYRTIREALDGGAPENPVMLLGNDAHHAAANSLAFAGATTPDGQQVPMTAESLAGVYAPFRELIAVDSRGEPSGGVNEGARFLVAPGFMDAMIGMDRDASELMPKVAKVLASRGITSIQDPASSEESVAKYKVLEDMGKMTFHLRATFLMNTENTHSPEGLKNIPDHVETLIRIRKQYSGDPLIHADGVKLFADGVLEGNPYAVPPTLPVAAALNGFQQARFATDEKTGKLDVVGYVDPEGPECESARTQAPEAFLAEHGFSSKQCEKSAGVLEHGEAFIHDYVAAMTKAGFNVHVHALSDKGVRVAIDAFEAVKPIADKLHLTQSMAHLQLVSPEDQKRIGDLGIYTTFIFSWAQPVEDYDMTVIPFIDQVQGVHDLYNPSHYYMQNVYPAKSIQDYGGIITAGSDAPVGSRDPMPFVNMETAVTRAGEGRVYNAKERLSIHDAIAAYTINGAAMLGQADKLGSLEPGKRADLILLDRNIVELAETGKTDDISETKVLVTVFGGEVVFKAAD